MEIAKESSGVDASSRMAVLRIVDANANRAAEGLRGVEEHCRFLLNDAHLTGFCKSLRHELSEALSIIPASERLAARDSAADVGANVSTVSESRRDDVTSVLTANIKRVEQALRCLEEYGKLLNKTMARQIEKIRYQTYTMEKALAATEQGQERLANAKLYVLLGGHDSLESFDQMARALIDAGVDILQLRDKTLTDRELLARAKCLRERTRESATLFVMNDRADLAALSHADGLHVGQDELTTAQARRIVGEKMLIGVSTHSLDQARAAVRDGANYIGVGPTFPSRTKSFAQFPGVDLLRAVASEIGLPAFAIGGIDFANVDEALASGINRIAVSSVVCEAADPAEASKRLLARLRDAR